jgi:hypothetical protein
VFVELMPVLAGRTVLITVAKVTTLLAPWRHRAVTHACDPLPRLHQARQGRRD